MTVNEIKPNILILEYRQEPQDKDYGSCLWARFSFNLDRYELNISSDCGTYGYKWSETPDSESFLHLMARCDEGYMLDKLYGSADIFDYDATKENVYEALDLSEEDKDALDNIFELFDIHGIPETENEFCTKFIVYSDGYFDFDNASVWCLPVKVYPANAEKIVSVFENCIKPKIKEILNGI